MMLSRVAESLYWMQRYRERAENIARLMEASLYLNIDAPGSVQDHWYPVLETTGALELFEKLYKDRSESKALNFLTFDKRNPNSILNCILRSRENARSVRPVITAEMWNELNTTHVYVQKKAAEGRAPNLDFFDYIHKSCQLFTGIMDTTLSHDEGWYFGRLGNLVERADQTSRMLDVKYFILLPDPEQTDTVYDDIQWTALLKSVSAVGMYRRKRNEVQHNHVVEFLILDPCFPRSIYSCLNRAEQSLKYVLEDETERYKSYQLIHALSTQLKTTKVEDIILSGLHEFLDNIQSRMIEINDSITSDFFAMRTPETVPSA